MKHFSLLLLVIGMVSCHGSNYGKQTQTNDTVLVKIDGKADGRDIAYLDSAIMIRAKLKVWKNDSSLEGKLVDATGFRIGRLVDTLKDSLKRPILDSLKKPIIRFKYDANITDTSLNKYIHLVPR